MLTHAARSTATEPPETGRRAKPARTEPLARLHAAVGNRAVARMASARPAPAIAPPIVHEVLGTAGRPLDSTTLTRMESRLGFDFTGVRLHDGPRAAESARAVSAAAYTVGSDVVVDSARFAGDRMLAHELTHVMQQSGAPPVQRSALEVGASGTAEEREADAVADAVAGAVAAGGVAHSIAPTAAGVARLQRISVWESITRFFGAEGTFEDAELQTYLTFLDRERHTEGHFDSDNKAREVVRRWLAGRAGYLRPSLSRRILMVREMIEGFTGDEDEAAIIALLYGSSDSEIAAILSAIGIDVLRSNIDGEERDQFEEFFRLYQQRTGAIPPTDLMAGTHTVTGTQSTHVESVLTPGSSVVGGRVVSGPVMTGLSPNAATDGAFVNAMVAAMRVYTHSSAVDFRALRAAGPPILPVSRTDNISNAAQAVTESHFAPYTRAASRAPAEPYHPGTYALSSIITDQSNPPVRITDFGSATYPGRLGWTEYWMTQDSTGGSAVLSNFNCDTSRPAPDAAEFTRARDRFVNDPDPANRDDIDDTIHSWPAEAAGGVVKIQPYSRESARQVRWDLFTILIHEMMHVLQHPNFAAASAAVGGQGFQTLKEGFADVMRHDLWDGAGNLQSRVQTAEYIPVRRQVEGGDYPLNPSVIIYHNDYDVSYTNARDIVFGADGVGLPNAKAAFFLGHTELLGLGPGTRTSAGSLAGLSGYVPLDLTDAETWTVAAGDDYASIRARANAGPAGIYDTGGAPVTSATPLSPGIRLRIPGIRWVRTVQNDTLATISTQNNVSVDALIRANALPAGTLPSFAFPPTTRILIPIH